MTEKPTVCLVGSGKGSLCVQCHLLMLSLHLPVAGGTELLLGEDGGWLCPEERPDLLGDQGRHVPSGHVWS